VARAVARREYHLDVKARKAQRLAARHRGLCLVALERAEPRRNPAHDVREHPPLDLRTVDRSTGRPGDGRHRTDVIEVAVGDEHGLDLNSER
jgi:hypothetical protein